jgi:hypothetical protein
LLEVKGLLTVAEFAKFRSEIRRIFLRGAQKSNQHLAALRIFFDFDDMTKSTALQRQLTDATQQEKRRPNARTTD